MIPAIGLELVGPRPESGAPEQVFDMWIENVSSHQLLTLTL